MSLAAVVRNIKYCQTKEDLHNVFWKAFLGKKCEPCASLKILILNAPCNGFGDLIFAWKLSNFLKKWYKCSVIIATPLAAGLRKLGADEKTILPLVNRDDTTKRSQCRLFARFKLAQPLETQDVILVGPITTDMERNFADVKKLIPYSNLVNTFFFSEYNDDLDKKLDFNTGVGANYDGIFITTPTINKNRLEKLPHPYAVIYVADIDGVYLCVARFIEMLLKKYSYNHFEVILPVWFKPKKSLINKIGRFYGTIKIINSKGSRIVKNDNDKTFVFRQDIFPVSNEVMLNIMKHSVDDMLLTGDQSISDGLSCCPEKNIFYQIASWKTEFGKKMARLLPNKYFRSRQTSCGVIEAVNYHPDHGRFISQWNFETRSKQKLDAILHSVWAINNDNSYKHLAQLISSSKTLQQIKNDVS